VYLTHSAVVRVAVGGKGVLVGFSGSLEGGRLVAVLVGVEVGDAVSLGVVLGDTDIVGETVSVKITSVGNASGDVLVAVGEGDGSRAIPMPVSAIAINKLPVTSNREPNAIVRPNNNRLKLI
jgi:hypothetical protein